MAGMLLRIGTGGGWPCLKPHRVTDDIGMALARWLKALDRNIARQRREQALHLDELGAAIAAVLLYEEVVVMQEADFHEVADEFINLANQLSEDWAQPFLSSVFMYAAARYNAHFFMRTDGKPERRQQALDYYSDQYRKMLVECMSELSDV